MVILTIINGLAKLDTVLRSSDVDSIGFVRNSHELPYPFVHEHYGRLKSEGGDEAEWEFDFAVPLLNGSR